MSVPVLRRYLASHLRPDSHLSLSRASSRYPRSPLRDSCPYHSAPPGRVLRSPFPLITYRATRPDLVSVTPRVISRITPPAPERTVLYLRGTHCLPPQCTTVLAIKNFGLKDEQPKASFVVQGHPDKEKDFLVHNTTSLRQRSIRIIVSVAVVKGYRVFSHDVKQAYLQSDEELSRQIFVVPKRKDLQFFEMSENDALDLRKPLYGNSNRGDY